MKQQEKNGKKDKNKEEQMEFIRYVKPKHSMIKMFVSREQLVVSRKKKKGIRKTKNFLFIFSFIAKIP